MPSQLPGGTAPGGERPLATYASVAHVARVSHAASDMDTGAMISMTNRLNELMAPQVVPRTRREVAAFFTGLDLVEPGLVRIPEWRPASVGDAAVRAQMWGAVGRKP
jgi:hypothetical protein